MVSDLTVSLNSLTDTGKLVQATDGMWLDAPGLDVIRMAALANDLGMRLSTMTGIAVDGGETKLIYHFVSGSTVLNVRVQTQQNSIQSIAPIVPAANWIEREIHDLYGVEFLGHPHLERFIRPPELPVGFFREKGGEAGKQQREHAQKKAS